MRRKIKFVFVSLTNDCTMHPRRREHKRDSCVDPSHRVVFYPEGSVGSHKKLSRSSYVESVLNSDYCRPQKSKNKENSRTCSLRKKIEYGNMLGFGHTGAIVTMGFRIWRSILAVVAGYVLAALGIGVLRGTTVVLLRHFAQGGGWTILSYRLLKLTYTLVSAIAGGYLAAAVADRKPRWHALAVSAVLAGAFLISHSKYAAHPVWYFNSLVILAVVGPLLGGYLEHRRVDRTVDNESKAYRAANVLVGGFLIGATLANRWSPSSDLLLPSASAAGRGVLTAIVPCVLGGLLVYAGLRKEQRSGSPPQD